MRPIPRFLALSLMLLAIFGCRNSNCPSLEAFTDLIGKNDIALGKP
jgi:hypothetical protein